MGLENKVHFLGKQDDVAHVISIATDAVTV